MKTKQNIIMFGVFIAMLFGPANLPGATIPFGVQFNVSETTVVDQWGWTIIYQGLYSENNVSISTVFDGVQSGGYIMYAARPVGSPTFTLLAAAPEADVRTHTSQNVTTSSNGAEWYYNGASIGFAKGGDSISQSYADVLSANSEYRLSWHSLTTNSVVSYDESPGFLSSGYRAGSTVSLNAATTWERLVLVPVPEPATICLLSLGGLLLGKKRGI